MCIRDRAKEWKEIRIGTEGAYPPFNNLNAKKELEGYEIDYGNLLCERMKVKCTWVVQDPVSYTHLDVYKRQQFTGDKRKWPFGDVATFVGAPYRPDALSALSLIHI